MSIFEGFKKSASQSANDQSPDEKALADFIKKRVEEVRSAGNRIAHEGTWMTNIAYLLGFDSVYYDTTNRQFRAVDGASRVGLRRNRVFRNLILPAVQNRQARLCKNMPRFEVKPEDSSNESKEDARLGYEVLLQLWDDEKVNLKRLPLTMWVQECGHAYLKVGFDDELGDELLDPVTGDFLGYEGKTIIEVVSPFEVFADPLATVLEEAQWIVQAKVRKLDYFKTRYPEKGPQVREEGAWLLSIQYEQRIQSLNNAGLSSAATSLQMKDAAIELSYYEKRSRKHPQGRHCIIANGIVLKDGPLPVGQIPFAKFDDILVAGKYYSEACITHARPLQDQYNKTLSREAQWINKSLAPKYIGARGHGIAAEGLNDTDELIEYDSVPGEPPPHASPVPVIPPYVFQSKKDLETALFEQFGLGEVSRGVMPSAGIPAVGMQLLLDQDETRVGIEVEQHEHSYAKVGQLMLMYEAKFRKTEAKLIQKSATGDVNVTKYTGADLPRKPDVRVVRGSTVPTSRSLRRQEVMNAYGNGLLGNQQDPLVRERVLGMMEFGDSEGIWKEVALDAAQSRRDITQIEKGQLPRINKFDNHPYLIHELNDYIKSDKYDTLAPEIQQLMQQVMAMRADIVTRLANPQINQMENNLKNGMRPNGEPLLDQIKDPESAEAGGMPPPPTMGAA